MNVRPRVVPQFAGMESDVDSVARLVGVPVTVTVPVRAVVEPPAAYCTMIVQLGVVELRVVVPVQVPPALENPELPVTVGVAVNANEVPVAPLYVTVTVPVSVPVLAVAGFNAGTGPVRASRVATPVPVNNTGAAGVLVTVTPTAKVSGTEYEVAAVGLNVTL